MNEVSLFDIQAEESFLSAVLTVPKCLDELDIILAPKMFYEAKYGLIWGVISHMHNRGIPVDGVTLKNKLISMKYLDRVGGESLITYLMSIPATIASVSEYVRIIKETYKRRLLVEHGDTIRQLALGGAPIDSILGLHADIPTDDTQIVEQVIENEADLFAILDRNTKNNIRLGIESIDEQIQGFVPGNIVIICARAGMGKTLFTIQALRNISEAQKKCLFISLEMSRAEVAIKLASNVLQEDSQKLKSNDQSKLRALQGFDQLKVIIKHFHIARPKSNINNIITTIRQHKAQHDIKVVAIDYIQLVSAGKDNRAYDIDYTLNLLKDLCVELDIVLLGIAQLNRLAVNDRPMLHHLKDSGSIEQIADYILGLQHEFKKTQDPADLHIMNLHIMKTRWGSIQSLKLYCDLSIGAFRTLSEREEKSNHRKTQFY